MRSPMTSMRAQAGVTLMELLVVVAIVGILAGIAYPSYQKSVTKTRRRAAQACLSDYAGFMERFYTANLRYDQDTDGNAVALPTLDCASTSNTGGTYSYSFDGAVATAAFTLQAVPQGVQATRDTSCGTLKLNQTGQRTVTGAAGANACW